MIEMIAELLKNIKQAALSHALSATMVVQGVAVQQVTVSDFSQQEASLSEMISEQERNIASNNQVNKYDDEKYWQDIEQIAVVSESTKDVSEVAPIVEDLYEEYIPEKMAQSNKDTSKVNSNGPLVSSNFGVTVASSSSSPTPTVSEASRAPADSSSKASGPTASGGQNNISAEAVAKAVQESKDSANSNSSSVAVESNEEKKEEIEEVSPAPREITDTSSPTEGASEGDAVGEGDDEGEESQDEDENQEEEESFEYLATLRLIKNGNESVQIINDQDELMLDSDAEYSIELVAESDFGSVNFNLENRDNNDLHTAQENIVPFSLNGDSGPNNDLTAYDFQEANYQLDLRAYDDNNQRGEILETRTVRFSVRFSLSPSGSPSGGSPEEESD